MHVQAHARMHARTRAHTHTHTEEAHVHTNSSNCQWIPVQKVIELEMLDDLNY